MRLGSVLQMRAPAPRVDGLNKNSDEDPWTGATPFNWLLEPHSWTIPLAPSASQDLLEAGSRRPAAALTVTVTVVISMRTCGWLMMLLVLLVPPASADGLAQRTGPPARSIAFERLPIDNALAQNTIQSMLQDKSGLMWFGTLGGLDVYDGHRFRRTSSDPRDPHALSSLPTLPRPEDRRPNAYQGGAFLDRELEIVAHTH